MFMRRLIQIALLFTFGVILLGSYTRLTDAGLGCPDWPGCYGKLLAPEADKAAWTEMIHRYFAGSLGLLIGSIFLINLKTKALPRLLTGALLALVVFQAALGMWTVTLKLLPVVVMAHLLGGFATLTLLWALYIQLAPSVSWPVKSRTLIALAWISWIILILQLILGGWTSANYAALVCPDFPYCQGQWFPAFHWEAFNPFTGADLPNPLAAFGIVERTSIHMAHRVGAVLVFFLVSALAIKLLLQKQAALISTAILLDFLLLLQLGLGVSNVMFSLPLAVAVLHTGMGVLLLLTLTTVVIRLKRAH